MMWGTAPEERRVAHTRRAAPPPRLRPPTSSCNVQVSPRRMDRAGCDWTRIPRNESLSPKGIVRPSFLRGSRTIEPLDVMCSRLVHQVAVNLRGAGARWGRAPAGVVRVPRHVIEQVRRWLERESPAPSR